MNKDIFNMNYYTETQIDGFDSWWTAFFIIIPIQKFHFKSRIKVFVHYQLKAYEKCERLSWDEQQCPVAFIKRK